MKIEVHFKALIGFIPLLLLNCALILSLVISDVVFAGAPFSNKDTPINQRTWREMWNRESNKKVPRYDKAYQEGKKIFNGRGNYQKYDYCVPRVNKETNLAKDESFSPEFVAALDKIKLSRKSIAPYRGITVINFAKVLYDCDEPHTLVLNKIEKEDAGLVIYYLHGRFNLQLKQELKGGGKLAKIRDPHGR